MKRSTRFIFLIVSMIVLVSIVMKPITIFAIEYSTGLDHRPLYTKKEIDEGALDELMAEGKVKFNSIKDETAAWYNETNFVGARLASDPNEAEYWENDVITAEDGELYHVRMFIHNNTISNPATWKDDSIGVAKDTHVAFNVPGSSGAEINVHGFISASNAEPQEVQDNVTFKSKNGQWFHLEYILDSATISNNGVGGDYPLGNNDIIKATSGGTLIGFDDMDGNVPGCYYFAAFVGITVKVVYDAPYFLEKSVRPVGGTNDDWTDSLAVNIGDEVEYQIAYRNTSGIDQRNVMIKDTLPSNLEYIPGSTRLWNSLMDGTIVEDTILTTAINIGHYAPNANAYVRFRAKVVDTNLACGKNTLVNWAHGTVDGVVLQDFANVTLQKPYPDTAPLLLGVMFVLMFLTYTVSKLYKRIKHKS